MWIVLTTFAYSYVVAATMIIPSLPSHHFYHKTYDFIYNLMISWMGLLFLIFLCATHQVLLFELQHISPRRWKKRELARTLDSKKCFTKFEGLCNLFLFYFILWFKVICLKHFQYFKKLSLVYVIYFIYVIIIAIFNYKLYLVGHNFK